MRPLTKEEIELIAGGADTSSPFDYLFASGGGSGAAPVTTNAGTPNEIVVTGHLPSSQTVSDSGVPFGGFGSGIYGSGSTSGGATQINASFQPGINANNADHNSDHPHPTWYIKGEINISNGDKVDQVIANDGQIHYALYQYNGTPNSLNPFGDPNYHYAGLYDLTDSAHATLTESGSGASSGFTLGGGGATGGGNSSSGQGVTFYLTPATSGGG